MKRKYLIWTLTGLGLLGGSTLALNRYSVLAQDPNNLGGGVQYRAPGALPVPAQPALAPVPGVPLDRAVGRYPSSLAANPNVISVHASQAFMSPAIHEDEMRVQLLLKEYQATKDEPKRKELVEQITKTVAHQFEEKQLVRERELKELEERVKELRSTHAKRESLKEKIITDRVQQLINNVDGVGWGYEPNNVMVPTMLPGSASPLLHPPAMNNAFPVIAPLQTTSGLLELPSQNTLGAVTGTAPASALAPSVNSTVAPATVLPNSEPGVTSTSPQPDSRPSEPKTVETTEPSGGR